MNLPRKSHAIKSVLLLALVCWCALAQAAQVAGTVMNLSGPLLATGADGTARILAPKSEVEQGDTLVTEKNTYALIKFIDNSEITLRPGSSMKIERFAFDAGKPDDDNAAFSLLKGGLRSITGLLGKRNKERFSLKTPSATIGIRGTTFIVEFVPESEAALAAARLAYNLASTAALSASTSAAAPRSDAPAAAPAAIAPLLLAQASIKPPPAGGLAPGLYVQVTDGMIQVSNTGGTQQFAAGQFGYTRNVIQPPVLLPANPGIRFTPPPTFSSLAPNNTGASGAAKAAAVDCEVR